MASFTNYSRANFEQTFIKTSEGPYLISGLSSCPATNMKTPQIFEAHFDLHVHDRSYATLQPTGVFPETV